MQAYGGSALGNLAAGDRVRLVGLQAKPELNGLLGTCVDTDEYGERWEVRLDDAGSTTSRTRTLKPANLQRVVVESRSPQQPGLAGAEWGKETGAVQKTVGVSLEAPRGDAGPPTASSDASIVPGSSVCVRGLQGRPELNGQVGTVVQWDDSEARWKVRMEDGSGKMLKPANLQVRTVSDHTAQFGNETIDFAPSGELPSASPAPILPGSSVCVFGLQARAELNGQFGIAVEWDEDVLRWKVRMPDGSGLMLKPSNLEVRNPVIAETLPPTVEATAERAVATSTSPNFDAIVVGSSVRVCALLGRSDLNGQHGTVMEWDDSNQRWKVRMADGTGKVFKPANLEPFTNQGGQSAQAGSVGADIHAIAPGMRVSISGLVARPELNGKYGTVAEWDEGESRWKVRTDDGTGLMLKPTNLMVHRLVSEPDLLSSDSAKSSTPSTAPSGLARGAIGPAVAVRVCGLTARPDLNGTIGTVVEWAEEGRWKVRMADGAGKMFKPENLEVAPAPAADVAAYAATAAAATAAPATSLPSPTSPEVGLLAPGARVRVKHLPDHPTLTGQFGTVMDWVGEGQRWEIGLDSGYREMLLPSNLEICGLGEVRAGVDASVPQHRRPTDDDAGTIAVDACVAVCGMQSRPELNGQRGTVVSWDGLDGRYRVRMADGSGKAFKPGNIQICRPEASNLAAPPVIQGTGVTALVTGDIVEGSSVRVTGLQGRPELNGQVATVVQWDDGEGRWKIRMADGSGKMLNSSNLEICNAVDKPAQVTTSAPQPTVDPTTSSSVSSAIQPGATVRVSGLQTRPELNGKCGTVVDWDLGEGRWKVRMADGLGKMFKPYNLDLLSVESSTVAPPTPSERGEAIRPGAAVCVNGLRARPEFNGQTGTVVEWDEGEKRWKVQMADGSRLMLKLANLEVLAVSDSNTKSKPSVSEKVSSQVDDIVPGASVLLIGLQGSPGMNGMQATVVEWDDMDERWKVKMADGSLRKFKASNLQVVLSRNAVPSPVQDATMSTAVSAIRPGSSVTVCGLPARPDLNGESGIVEAWDGGEERWKVRMASGSGKLLKPENLELSGKATVPSEPAPSKDGSAMGLIVGSRVRVHGLIARPDLNGLHGTLVDFDEEEGRWRVRFDDGAGKLLWPANLEISASAQSAVSGDTQKNVEVTTTHSHAPAPASSQKIEEGQVVRVCGLQARPELNGQEGTVVEFDDGEGRWKVWMNDGSGKMFKPSTLEIVQPVQATRPPVNEDATGIGPGVSVRTCDLRARPELNGLHGTVVEFDDTEERWKVRMADGTGKMFKTSNLEACQFGSEKDKALEGAPSPVATQFSPMPRDTTLDKLTPDGVREIKVGDAVRICGLQAKPELNGLEGTAVEWDEHESRWKVRIQDGSGKMLKPANLVLCNVIAMQSKPMNAEVPETFTPPSQANSPQKLTGGGEREVPPGAKSADARPEIKPGQVVRVCGLQSRNDLNGLEGTVVEWDEGERRWKVVLSDGSGKMLKPENLDICNAGTVSSGMLAPDEFSPGQRVRVCGVQQQPALNGLAGTIVAWEHGEARWKVRMTGDGSGKMLKSENLELCSPDALEEDRSPVVPFDPASARMEQEIKPGMAVRVRGLKARPELNGSEGTVLEWHEVHGRWKVVMADGTGKMFNSLNLEVFDDNVEKAKKPDISDPSCVVGEYRSDVKAEPLAREQSKPHDAADELKPGVLVQLCGLQGRPELNDLEGTLVGFDEDESRWKVLMADGSRKMLKPANLKPQNLAHVPPRTTSKPEGVIPAVLQNEILQGQTVRVRGLQMQPDLNGLEGTVVGWDSAEGRWRVQMMDGSGKMLKASNLEVCQPSVRPAEVDEAAQECVTSPDSAPALKPDQVVRVQGLQARPELNGSEGTLVEWDANEERWKVKMADGSGKMFKSTNLEACVPCPAQREPQSLFSGTPTTFEHGQLVRVKGLQSQPELNGVQGVIAGWDEPEGRWKLRLADGSGKMLKPANIEPYNGVSDVVPERQAAMQPAQIDPLSCTGKRADTPMGQAPPAYPPAPPAYEAAHASSPSRGPEFASGQAVRVRGLSARPDLNGQEGTIVELDELQGRWRVLMADGTGKMLKPANLEACDATTNVPNTKAASPIAARSADPPPDFLPGQTVRVRGLQTQGQLNGMEGTVVAWDDVEDRWRVRMHADGSGKALKSANLELCNDRGLPSASAFGNSNSISPSLAKPSSSEEIEEGAVVRISGLQARPELNGQRGTCVDFDESELRWRVRMEDGAGKMLKASNLERCDDLLPPTASSRGGGEKSSIREDPPPSSGGWPQQQASPPGGPAPGARLVPPKAPPQPMLPLQLTVGCSIRVCGLQARPELNGQAGEVVAFDEAENRWKVRMADGSGKMLKAANLEVSSGPRIS